MSRDEDRYDEQRDLDGGQAWREEDDLFDEFESQGEFDDSDRDSDFAPVYDAESVEEEDPAYLDDLQEDEDASGRARSEFADWEDAELEDDGADTDPGWEHPEDRPATAPEELEAEDPEEPVAVPLPPMGALEAADPAADWEEEPDYYEAEEESPITLPLGLILVGAIALILLGAGGYGVMQQRAAMQEEVRQLRAQLAKAASPGEVAQTRATNQALASRNSELESRLEFLERENRTLQATVGGLEKQLQAQQDALNKPVSPPAPAQPRPAPKPVERNNSPVQTAPAAPVISAGSWFVNFGSYSRQSTAQSWADRLQPGAGDVVVTTGEKDGRTFYRVRVVNLSSRGEADATARSLEQRYDLARLWVGQAN